MTHSSTIRFYDYSWDGPYIVMDDAIGIRLQTYAWPTPGPSKSMIVAETVLTLSWAMGDAILNRLQTYALPPPGPFYMSISLDDSTR